MSASRAQCEEKTRGATTACLLRVYDLHFEDHTSADRRMSGKTLLDSGLTVSLPLPESSELVFIKEGGVDSAYQRSSR